MLELDNATRTVVDDFVGRVRASLQDAPPDEREMLVSYARAEVELEAEVRHVPPNDALAMRSMLAGLGSPEQYARDLRFKAGARDEIVAEVGLTACRACRASVSLDAVTCPHCGAPYPARKRWTGWGYEWKSAATYRGWPLVHVAVGRDANGKLRVAKGVVAIGQFGIGAFTIAQFGVAYVAGLGQFMVAPISVGQFALGLFAAGQFGFGLIAGAGMIATGIVATGLKAFGIWTRSGM